MTDHDHLFSMTLFKFYPDNVPNKSSFEENSKLAAEILMNELIQQVFKINRFDQAVAVENNFP